MHKTTGVGLCAAFLLVTLIIPSSAFASRFLPYEGRMYDGSGPAEGEYDFVFYLCSAPDETTCVIEGAALDDPTNSAGWGGEAGVSVVWASVIKESLVVTRGHFGTVLGTDLNPIDPVIQRSVFTYERLYLGMAVRDANSPTPGEWKTFVGRQVVLPAAYLSDGEVDSADIRAGAVSSSHVAADSLTANDLAANSVGTSEVEDNSLTANDLAANSVGTSEVADNDLTANDLAANSVGTSEVADNTLTANDLAADSVGTSEVDDNTLTANDLAANSVGSSELADNAVDNNALNLTLSLQDALNWSGETEKNIGAWNFCGLSTVYPHSSTTSDHYCFLYQQSGTWRLRAVRSLCRAYCF